MSSCVIGGSSIFIPRSVPLLRPLVFSLSPKCFSPFIKTLLDHLAVCEGFKLCLMNAPRGFTSSCWCSSPTGGSSERGLDLLQRLALGLGDEGHGEDDVEDAHGGEQPEGSSAGEENLEKVKVTSTGSE